MSQQNIGAYAAGGGTVNVGGNAIGQQYTHHEESRRRPGRQQRADVGVLTVLTEELSAVVEVLQSHRNYRSFQLPQGAQAYTADVPAEGGNLRVVATQTLDRGPRSAAVAYDRLQASFRPSVVLLVGIAGGIDAKVDIGDVVIADQVVYYDARRETEDGPQRRGQSHPMTPAMRHRLNEFFRRSSGSVAAADGRNIRVWRGPIGSGDAVVTDRNADIIAFLRRFNEKTLAVETEAGGVGQASYEYLDAEQVSHGWLTIRGISDHADREKGYAHHALAARHAALVMDRLLPLLRLEED
ncbi:5'-methylthioadenosine/S-adenosylhomocysteine nucleosidase [Dactylosporangium sucinum]|uniref:5'-methylthioadenosine/S-adenosylhomocysteine nucleosidase n=1 Tax=Dactylosporangium sucinum TaxID=1424081 RepID=A0A917TVM2_9ACTN|nr:5'-methylthioadenosine/S-adenosylhomocysteine nucleosidase [Dactylosporangium sucinum]GGM40121.1 5'-methylthioadenosine/S-adenosylhomocysteine nucleosidase [Dactylosporangium sucinum]